MTEVERRGVRRVLRLVDGYLSTLDQDTLTAWGGGMMTWGELRQHVKAAAKVMRAAPPRKKSSEDTVRGS